MIENEANPNDENKDKWTPLHFAAKNGHFEIVQLLIEKKANMNAKEKNGWTPLHCAAEGGHFTTVQLLIEKRANATEKTTKGLSALDVLKESKVISNEEDRKKCKEILSSAQLKK